MIIFNGEKYSCVSCIRGHRSSTCKHSERMLVKVRTRGRPAPVDVRKVILVDNDSRVCQNSEEECKCLMDKKTGCGCSSTDRQPILFLRAIATKKALLVDGNLKIMVTSESNTPNSEIKELSKNLPRDSCAFVSEDEFLLKHSVGERPSCCSSHEKINMDGFYEQSNLEEKFKNHFLTNSDASEPKRTDMQFPDDSVVELFTQKGAFLSSSCECDENNCPCGNCLIHRKEEELEHYLQELNQPLIPLGNAHLMTYSKPGTHSANYFADHHSQSHENHSQPNIYNASGTGQIKVKDIVSISELLVRGVLNYEWKRTTVINYKEKLIPSRYWWDFITAQIPIMTKNQLRYLDLLEWFDNLIRTYDSELLSYNEEDHEETYNYIRKESSTGINNVITEKDNHQDQKNNGDNNEVVNTTVFNQLLM